MKGHLTDEQVVDLLEGSAGWDARHHTEACSECAGQVAQASEGWALASEAQAPEPSPLYWDAFRRQVDRRIDSEKPPFWQRSFFPPLLAAAAVLAGLVGFIPIAPPPVVAPSTPTLPAWSALPAADEDAGLTVLAALPSDDLEAVANCQGVNDCLESLSDDESQTLASTLREELSKRSRS